MGDQDLLMTFKIVFLQDIQTKDVYLQITPNKRFFSLLFCFSFFLSQVTETVLAVPAVWAAAAALGVARVPRAATSRMGVATMLTLAR